MKKMKRTLFGFAASALVAAGIAAGTATTASAATVCSGTHLDNWSIPGGYIAVYYNSSTGNNCAMTYTNTPGVSQRIGVSISLTDVAGSDQTDDHTYKYYAGPVSVHAPGHCIDFSGIVGNNSLGWEGVTHAYCS